MNISFSAPVSAMKAVEIRQDLTANSIANTSTPSYVPKIPVQAELNESGTYVSSVQPAPDNGLADQMTDMVQNKNMYSANAKVIKVEDRMLGELLDMVG